MIAELVSGEIARALGLQVPEIVLANLDAVAEKGRWSARIPDAVKTFTQVDGHWVSAPTNVHRVNMVWASKAAFDKIGASAPKSWEEFNALASRFREAGIIAYAELFDGYVEQTRLEIEALDKMEQRISRLDAKLSGGCRPCEDDAAVTASAIAFGGPLPRSGEAA